MKQDSHVSEEWKSMFGSLEPPSMQKALPKGRVISGDAGCEAASFRVLRCYLRPFVDFSAGIVIPAVVRFLSVDLILLFWMFKGSVLYWKNQYSDLSFRKDVFLCKRGLSS